MVKFYVVDKLKLSKYTFINLFFFSQASFKKLNELNSYSNTSNKENGTLNPITLNNLNDFYIQAPAGDGINGTFNLSNFYMNHGKYFSSGSNLYNSYK